MCGEQTLPSKGAIRKAGSSPRVRGTVGKPVKLILKVRFIPACAGNSPQLQSVPCRMSVHPRVCGEQNVRLRGVTGNVGSSPRVRGTVQRSLKFCETSRFIPACAGNSPSTKASLHPGPVHPRVCGEQETTAKSARPGRGSSPRVRGTGSVRFLFIGTNRFIPACAGNRM